jgi:trehalose synthase
MLRVANLLSTRSYKDYEHFYTCLELEEIKSLAERLSGKRIVHVNATDNGGGVAEILHSLVPFEQSLNVLSSWRVLTANKSFFSVTKKIHNALQGSQVVLGRTGITDDEWQLYLEQSKDIAYALASVRADLLLIHDPQPLMAGYLTENNAHKLARIHIDLSSPNEKILSLLMPCLKKYERIIFSLHSYVPNDINEEQVSIISPAIDPLSKKNIFIKRVAARRLLASYGVTDNGPLIAQISRFDPWKDPIGVIQAFQAARKSIPGLQLILMGSIHVDDDPESVAVLREIRAYVKKDPSIIIITEHNNELVNVVQTAADIILQKSLREGFGLTATEAMWKRTPIIAGNIGGLRIQVQNGENGYLVNSVEEATTRIIELFKDERLRKHMGEHGHETARERFLLPRESYDHLRLYADVLGV